MAKRGAGEEPRRRTIRPRGRARRLDEMASLIVEAKALADEIGERFTGYLLAMAIEDLRDRAADVSTPAGRATAKARSGPPS